MERKLWLKIFLDLADQGKPALLYRKKLRIMLRQLPGHVRKIPKYRAELAEILKKEQEEQEEMRRVEEDKQRKREEIKAKAAKAAKAARVATSKAEITPNTPKEDPPIVWNKSRARVAKAVKEFHTKFRDDDGANIAPQGKSAEDEADSGDE